MLEAKGIIKSYKNNKVLDCIDLIINEGDFISVVGESGKGKTTLLNILGLLEKPDHGVISVNGLVNPQKKDVLLIQRHYYGYIFQNFALIENETVENNLQISLEYRKTVNKRDEIISALQKVNLEGTLKKKIFELSGGEQQRIALARVMLKDCCYVFADEPTGNLDAKNRDLVFDILKNFSAEGKAVIYTSHDPELARKASRTITL